MSSLWLLVSIVGAAPLTLTSTDTPVYLELTRLPPDGLVAGLDLITWQGLPYQARIVSWGRRRVSDGQVEEVEEFIRPPDPEFYEYVLYVCLLISIAGIMAGCTMGVLSLDPLLLKLKQLEGSEEEKAWANAVLPVLGSHHQLLVALLLCNAGANEALPVFLGKLVDEKTAILISVTCVLIFGEILPSAIMTGPQQLRIAAFVAPGIRLLLIATSPLSWPMAKLLDWWLGHQDGMTRFKRKEFKALIKLQHRAKGWKARSAVRPDDTVAKSSPAGKLVLSGAPAGDAQGAASPAGATPSAAPRPLARTRTPAALRRQLSDLVKGNRQLSPPVKAAGVAEGTHDEAMEADTEFTDDEVARQRIGRPCLHSTARTLRPSLSCHGCAKTLASPCSQVTILQSVFSLQSKRVSHLLEPGRNTWADVRMLGEEQKMDMEVMSLITRWGVSRIPIYRGKRRDNVVGLLLVKEHLILDPDDATPIASLRLRRPCVVHPTASIFDLLNLFQTGHSHMALVSEDASEIGRCWSAGRDVPGHVKVLGLCTIEDVIEEMIGEEVLDETDLPRTLAERELSRGSAGALPAALNPEALPHAAAAAEAGITEAERALGYSASDPLLGNVGAAVR